MASPGGLVGTIPFGTIRHHPEPFVGADEMHACLKTLVSVWTRLSSRGVPTSVQNIQGGISAQSRLIVSVLRSVAGEDSP